MSDKKLIFELIPKVMKDVGAIGKNGFNSYDKYKFRSIDDVYNKLQPVLAEHGVFFVPKVLESFEEKSESKNGTAQTRVKIKIEYIIFAKDGSQISTIVEGEGIDRGDKASNKAMTAAFKYMLIQIFCIAVEGMDDADSEIPEMKMVKEKPAEIKKNFAPGKDYKIKAGTHKGKSLSDFSDSEIRSYIDNIDIALMEKNQKEPSWFTELKKEVGYKCQ